MPSISLREIPMQPKSQSSESLCLLAGGCCGFKAGLRNTLRIISLALSLSHTQRQWGSGNIRRGQYCIRVKWMCSEPGAADATSVRLLFSSP